MADQKPIIVIVPPPIELPPASPEPGSLGMPFRPAAVPVIQPVIVVDPNPVPPPTAPPTTPQASPSSTPNPTKGGK
jgi:hypothetical protein